MRVLVPSFPPRASRKHRYRGVGKKSVMPVTLWSYRRKLSPSARLNRRTATKRRARLHHGVREELNAGITLREMRKNVMAVTSKFRCMKAIEKCSWSVKGRSSGAFLCRPLGMPPCDPTYGGKMAKIHISSQGDKPHATQKRQFFAFAVSDKPPPEPIEFISDDELLWAGPLCHHQQRRQASEIVSLYLTEATKRKPPIPPGVH